MEQPWLDNLSEDWDSAPGSSPSAALQSTCTDSSHQTAIGSIELSKKEIRRRSTSDRYGREALLECNNNHINIHANNHPTDTYRRKPSNAHDTQTSSISSRGSQSQFQSVVRKTRSNSPPKNRSTDTPDWKRLLSKGNGTCTRNDLFSPLRLEGIFRARALSMNENEVPGISFSFFASKDQPSSPPPWLAQRNEQEAQTLSGDSEVAEDAPLEAYAVHRSGQTCPLPESLGGEAQRETAMNADFEPPIQSGQYLFNRPKEAVSETASTCVNVTINNSFGSSLAKPANHNVQSRKQEQNPTSDSNPSAFSPVYISKHKTAEGLVDYSALDLSTSQIKEQMRHTNVRAYQLKIKPEMTSGAGVHSGPVSVGGNDCLIYPPESDGIVVNCPSTVHDSMDSPLSSSILPSDSISQVHGFMQPPSPIHFRAIDSQNDNRSQTLVGDDLEISRPQTPPVEHLDPASPGKARSPRSPLKLFGNHDTFTNVRLLSRMAQLHDLSSSQQHKIGFCNGDDAPVKSILISHDEPPSPARVETRNSPTHMDDLYRNGPHHRTQVASLPKDDDSREDQDVTQSKRYAPEVFKQSTPKRQRTIGHQENLSLRQHDSQFVDEEHRPLQKSSIRGAEQTDCARLSLLYPRLETTNQAIARPRNPTPSHTQGFANVPNVSYGTQLDALHECVEHASGSPVSSESPKPSMAVPECANFLIKQPNPVGNSIRKPSVSTQDYLDEATKIMDLIRSNRPPATHMSQVETAIYEQLTRHSDEIDNHSIETISRPPSREGGYTGWRDPHERRPNRRVQSYLRRYEETGDESFMTASLRHSPGNGNLDARFVDPPSDIQSMKVHDRPARAMEQSPEESDNDNDNTLNSPMKTHSSNHSIDSTGQTIESKSSGRTRTVPVIVPGKVHHLISSIENATGMRYDVDKQSWMKDKKSGSSHLGSSSTGTEDPFGSIPDLIVDGSDIANETGDEPRCIEQPRSPSMGHDSPTAGPQQSHHQETPSTEKHNLYPYANPLITSDLLRAEQERQKQQHGILEQHSVKKPTSNVHDVPSLDVHVSRNVPHNDGTHLYEHSECSFNYDRDVIDDSEIALGSSQQVSPLPAVSVRSKRRDVSVVFSSPPVSHEWIAPYVRDSPSPVSIGNFMNSKFSNSHVKTRNSSKTPNQARKRAARQASQSMTLSRIDEFHELSVVETQPNGRCLSLTLSVSTPVPMHRTTAVSILPQWELDLQGFSQSLSPLSEFTIHQDDALHMDSRRLCTNQQIVPLDCGEQPAAVVQELFRALSEAEPDEPYWDTMRRLNLSSKRLHDLHALCEVCPSVEELNLSHNHLAHLSGIPALVRQLNISSNKLSTLTSWNHLAHLQYLDLSNNDLDSLEALGNLVQLRELRAENNKITSLEGVYDLDSLLSLRVKGNVIDQLDLRSADLRRLSYLDVSHNKLVSIEGLEQLALLEELDLSHNQLTAFPSIGTNVLPLPSLRKMLINHNKLSSCDLDSVPTLRHLEADGNHLCHIKNLERLRNLELVSLHDQHITDATSILAPASFRDIHHLLLSGLALRSLPIMSRLLNLQTLDVSFTGIQTLPTDLGILAPNIRTLNLNFNHLKTLQQLRGMGRLRQLFVAGNKLARLRKTVRSVCRFQELEELDLRDNPFSTGFYVPTATIEPQRSEMLSRESQGVTPADIPLRHLLSPMDRKKDLLHVQRLDEDSRLRRRVYELLLAAKCGQRLEVIDGLQWQPRRDTVLQGKDDVWDRLVSLGVVVKVTTSANEVAINVAAVAETCDGKDMC